MRLQAGRAVGHIGVVFLDHGAKEKGNRDKKRISRLVLMAEQHLMKDVGGSGFRWWKCPRLRNTIKYVDEEDKKLYFVRSYFYMVMGNGASKGKSSRC